MLDINIDFLNSFLGFKTHYFISVSEFYKIYNLANNLSFKIFSYNIRSANANFDELILFLESGTYG